MCFIVLPQRPVRRLFGAAQNVQSLLDDGTLNNAFNKTDHHANTLAVIAFDVLAEGAERLMQMSEMQELSPFLRYRRETLANNDTAVQLRALVLNLWGGLPGLDLSDIFKNADEHHTRIALEMIASYTRHGERDPQFMALTSEIRDMEPSEVKA